MKCPKCGKHIESRDEPCFHCLHDLTYKLDNNLNINNQNDYISWSLCMKRWYGEKVYQVCTDEFEKYKIAKSSGGEIYKNYIEDCIKKCKRLMSRINIDNNGLTDLKKT